MNLYETLSIVPLGMKLQTEMCFNISLFSEEIYHKKVMQAVVVINPLFILEIQQERSAQVTLFLRMYFNGNHSHKIHLSKLISSPG